MFQIYKLMMAVDTGVDAVFEEYSEYLCKENDVKEVIKEVTPK